MKFFGLRPRNDKQEVTADRFQLAKGTRFMLLIYLLFFGDINKLSTFILEVVDDA